MPSPDPDDWLAAALAARRTARTPAPLSTRTTHRADPADPSLPPLHACREADLLAALSATRPGQPHTLLTHDARTGWRPWRAWP